MTTLYVKGGGYVAALRPVYGDVVVITTLGGQVEALDAVADYDVAISRAMKLAGKRGGAVKVLPMTMCEALGFFRISVDEFMSDLTDEEWRERCIAVCTPALMNPDPRVRADATAVLTGLEGLPQC